MVPREPKELEAQKSGLYHDGENNSEPSIEPQGGDGKREQKLIRKMDLHILPFVVLLYLFSFLDRGTFLFAVVILVACFS